MAIQPMRSERAEPTRRATSQDPARGTARSAGTAAAPAIRAPDADDLERFHRARLGDRAASEASPAVPDEPQRSPEGFDWDAIAPVGFYARIGRPLLNLCLLVVVLPVALLLGLPIALANLISFKRPSLVFFTQPRVGHRGRVFRIIKFRTMREPRVDSFDSWGSGGDQARVTRFGRLLRNTHLDELPQILNILRGDMSFIGPRPEMVEIETWALREIPEFSTRLAVKPGITGYAQITQGYTGRDVEAYTEKLRVNQRYLSQLSFLLDVSILFRTCIWMLRGRGWSWRSQAEGKSAG